MRTGIRRTLPGAVLLGCAALITSAAAQQPRTCTGPQLGTWKLQSFTTQYQDTGLTVQPFGTHPSGYLSYGPDCRMYGILVREGRKPPTASVPTNAEKIALFDGLGAYAGTYTIEGDKVSHHVDISWIEAWTGTTAVRHFRIVGNLLHIRTDPEKDSENGRISTSTLVWTKVQ